MEWPGASIRPVPATDLQRARLATAAAFAAQGALFAVLLTHLPQFKTRWGVGDGTITLTVLVVSLLAGAGSVAAESVAARASSAAALRAGLLVIAAAAVAIALAPDRVVFFGAFGLYGLGLGAVDAGSNMQAVAVQHRYGRSILTSFHAVWSGAGIVGALWVAASNGLGLRASVLAGAAAVVLLAAVASGGLVRGAPVVSTAVAVPWRPVLLLGAAMVCFYVADAATSNWSAIYLHDTLHALSGTAALGYAAYQATGLLARVAGDQVVRRVGIVPTVRAAAVIGAVGMAVVVLAPDAWTAIVGFAVVGCGLPVVAPLCFSAAGLLAPEDADAVVARVNVFNYAGSILGGVAVGLVGTVGQLRFGFLVPLVLALALLGLARAFAPAPVAVAA
jgi:hypothetical protein